MGSKSVVGPDRSTAAGSVPYGRALLSGSLLNVIPAPLARILVTGHPHSGSVAMSLAQRIADVHGAKLDTLPAEALTVGASDDLIVLEPHRLADMLPGSLQHRLLARTSGALLLVPTRPSHLPDHPPLFRSVLCAVEFADTLRSTLAFAGSFGGGGERLSVVHVIPDDFPGEYPHGRYRFIPNQLEPHLVTVGREVLERLAGPLDGRFDLRVTVAGPAREIRRLEKELAPDLLVLAGPFDTGTLHHVANHAVCPLLFVPGLPPA
jgi:nucleotide-binding universal stress UspA family protein